jgi:hypothetical protein
MMEILSYVGFWWWDDEWYLIAVYQELRRAFYTAEGRLGQGTGL